MTHRIPSQWERTRGLVFPDMRIFRATPDGLERNDCVELPQPCSCGGRRGVVLLTGEHRCRKCGRRTQQAA